MYRTIVDYDKTFREDITPLLIRDDFERTPINDSYELEAFLKEQVEEATADGKAALALSGGIDSAILAKFMPKGSKAYTFKCVVPGIEVTDETPMAAKYAEECGLDHEIIEIYWEDVEKLTPELIRHKGLPFHSIEVQIYKAALKAKADGFEKFIFGENADIIYGGMDGLLAKDWTFGEFVDRYSYVMPYHVLKDPQLILEPFEKYTVDGHTEPHDFINEYFRLEALGTYNNACNTAGIKFVGPFSMSYMNVPMDYARIRRGDTKYMIREIFPRLYKDFQAPDKIPMPRPVNEWFKDWKGPTRPEFWPHCTDNMTGNQKWMVYCLERFLDVMEF